MNNKEQNAVDPVFDDKLFKIVGIILAALITSLIVIVKVAGK